MNLCTLFAIGAVIIIAIGFLIMIIGAVIAITWIVLLLAALLATGGPGGAAFATSWPVLLVAFGITFFGFLVVSFGYFLLWLGSLLCKPPAVSSSSALTLNQSSLFSFLKPSGIDFGSFFGNGLDILGILLLPDEQRQKLPPNILEIVECLRKCFCGVLCKETHGDSSVSVQNPGQVIVDAGKSLLEDLNAQLEFAKRKLQEARDGADVNAAIYWGNKVTELTQRITQLGG